MKRACVVGWPVAHSRSPLIHRYWLATNNVDGSYEKEAVRPDDFASFLGKMVQMGCGGANITLPHKELAYKLVDETDSAADGVRAVNTIWVDGDNIIASNTDIYGFMTHLGESAPGWDREDKPVAVLGAGGAARAIIYGLLEASVEEIRLFNRTGERAGKLAEFFGPKVKPFEWQSRSKDISSCGLLVNTTTLGMVDNPPLEIDLSGMAAGSVVADIVYTPLQTALLNQARKTGLRTVDGLGMLLHQAVPGFEKWFGVRPQVTEELRALIVEDIEITSKNIEQAGT